LTCRHLIKFFITIILKEIQKTKYFFSKKKKKKKRKEREKKKLGVAGTTPKTIGVVPANPLAPWGWPSHPLVPKGVLKFKTLRTPALFFS
jgi:hypothetical protein